MSRCPPVPANDVVAPIHDRMPLAVSPELYAEWLDPDVPGSRALRAPTFLVASLILREPLQRRQALGLGCAALALILITATQ